MSSSVSGQAPPLSLVERAALGIGRLANRGPVGKRLQYYYHYWINRTWVREAVGRRVYVDNIESVVNLRPDRGVLMAANHRSFYDQWINMLALYDRGGNHFWKMYFPVRSNFFYDDPVGMAVNTVVAAWSMFPPIYRDASKADLTRDALAKVQEFLGDPTAIVGVHPEGTRGKGPDPYELLPAQPGIGQMILQGKPVVIPFFINGIGNKPAEVIATTQKRDGRRTDPIIIVYGSPVEYDDLASKKPRAALYLKMAKRVNAAISELMPREQELRAGITSGEIGDDDPGWLAAPLPWNK